MVSFDKGIEMRRYIMYIYRLMVIFIVSICANLLIIYNWGSVGNNWSVVQAEQATFWKTADPNSSSAAQNYLNSAAKLVQKDGKTQVIITTKNGGGQNIQKMQIQGGSPAQVQTNGNEATVTFDLPNLNGTYTV